LQYHLQQTHLHNCTDYKHTLTNDSGQFSSSPKAVVNTLQTRTETRGFPFALMLLVTSRLSRLQKACHTTVTRVLQQLHLLPVKYCIIFKLRLLMHKTHNRQDHATSAMKLPQMPACGPVPDSVLPDTRYQGHVLSLASKVFLYRTSCMSALYCTSVASYTG